MICRLRCAAVVLAALGLAGCATSAGVQVVKVPVAVECRVQAPDRPAMPTETLTEASPLDAIVAAALAEIELREGYETQLQAALTSCTRPIP